MLTQTKSADSFSTYSASQGPKFLILLNFELSEIRNSKLLNFEHPNTLDSKFSISWVKLQKTSKLLEIHYFRKFGNFLISNFLKFHTIQNL
jgi:hypothetical protein